MRYLRRKNAGKGGKYGKYLACSNYPACKNTKSLNEKVAKCPKCGKDVVKRVYAALDCFYGCTGYPECDFVSWDIPTGELCPKCGSYLVYKTVRAKRRCAAPTESATTTAVK